MSVPQERLADKVEAVNHPAHYGGDDVYETIKVLKAWMPPQQYFGFLLGNALKYDSRLGKKPDQPISQDLRKSAWYTAEAIRFAIECEEKGISLTGASTPHTPATIVDEVRRAQVLNALDQAHELINNRLNNRVFDPEALRLDPYEVLVRLREAITVMQPGPTALALVKS